MKSVHYRPSGKRPVCIDTRWNEALTVDKWKQLWMRTDMSSTNIYRVTCPACLKQIVFDINNRLGK